jgi:hypothetical protein
LAWTAFRRTSPDDSRNELISRVLLEIWIVRKIIKAKMAKKISRTAPGIRLLSKRRLKAASFIIVIKRGKVNT